MSARDHIVRLLRELNLPIEQYVIGGSGVLALRNLRPIRDLDLFVRPRLYRSLQGNGDWMEICQDPDDPIRKDDPPYLERIVQGIHVNAFHDWKHRGFQVDVQYHLDNPEWISADNQMWPTVSLNHILQWKIATARPKDKHDVQLIEAYLAGGGTKEVVS